jgi:hypothetical protein
MLGAQTSRTEVKPFLLTINNNSDRVDVRQPLTLGMALRMADIVTELGCFIT